MAFTLSVCLIVRNEEPVLARGLSCAAKIADELIVVDTGSTDRSVEIARRFTPFVYLHPWQQSFAKARNYSYSKATGDYIMWLDADDVITDENIGRINALKTEETDADVIFTIYKRHSDTGLTDYIMRDRIIRRTLFSEWLYDIHEAILIEPEWKVIYRTDIEIKHKKEYVNEPDRNMGIFQSLLESGKELSLFEKENLVKELSLHEKTDEAVSLFNSIKTELNPQQYAYAFAFLMIELVRAGRWKECYDAVEEAGEYITDTPRMLYIKGICMERMGNEEKAEQLYRKAIASEEDPFSLSVCYTGYNDYYPYLQLAEIAGKNGEIHKALRYIAKAGKAYPKDKAWLNKRLSLMMLAKIKDNTKRTISENISQVENKMSKQNKIEELKGKIDEINELLRTASNEELEELLSDRELTY